MSYGYTNYNSQNNKNYTILMIVDPLKSLNMLVKVDKNTSLNIFVKYDKCKLT